MCTGLQCLMCTADHLALAQELWCTMNRDPLYIFDTAGKGLEAHMCDYRANISQAEMHTWQTYPQISRKIRSIKKDSDIIDATHLRQVEQTMQIFQRIREVWSEVMELRFMEERGDE